MVLEFLIFYCFTTDAFFKFRQTNSVDKDGYRVPFYPVLPGVYLAVIIILVLLRAYYETEKSVHDLTFVLTGIPAYFLLFKKRMNHQ